MSRILQHVVSNCGKLFKRSPPDMLLLGKAAALLIVLRVLLQWLPAHRLVSLVDRLLRKPVAGHREYARYVRRVAWSIEAAGNYLLRNRCLAQALAARILLNRKRIRTRLYIGVIDLPGKRSAHAWLTADEEVIMGNNPLISFYTIVPLPCRNGGAEFFPDEA